MSTKDTKSNDANGTATSFPLSPDKPTPTMRAVLWEGKPFQVAVRDVPRPTIELPEDAIVRMATASICGTDLHTYRGHLGLGTPPWVLGHEGTGVVVGVGPATEQFKVGDRVVLPWGPDSGHFSVDAEIMTTYLGYGQGVVVPREEGGEIGGCQAEYLRVPSADDSLVLIPDDFSPDLDWLFLSDAFPTAWSGLDFSGFQPGESVAVFGLGPVGLLAVYSARLRGASVVYAVDHIRDRLDRAAGLGAVPIDFTSDEGTASLQILRRRPEGVMRVVDCVGFEAVNHQLKRDQNYVINEGIAVASVNGGFGLIGVYAVLPQSKGTRRGNDYSPIYEIDMSTAFVKNLTIRSGIAPEYLNLPVLFDLVRTKRADLDFVVSAQMSIEDAPEAYERIEKGLETKVVFRFPWNRQEGDMSGVVKVDEKGADGVADAGNESGDVGGTKGRKNGLNVASLAAKNRLQIHVKDRRPFRVTSRG